MPEKKEKGKNITNDALARMIKRGFDNTPTKQQFEVLESKVDVIEEDLKEVKEKINGLDLKLATFIETYDKAELPMRVEYIENVLALPKK